MIVITLAGIQRASKNAPAYKHILTHFKESISLDTVVGLAHMESFTFFNSVKKKSLTRFVNEIRIGNAGKLPIDAGAV